MTTVPFISNSSPLIAFERLNRLDLLQALTVTLLIPTAVQHAVFGTKELPAWIVERPISLLSMPFQHAWARVKEKRLC